MKSAFCFLMIVVLSGIRARGQPGIAEMGKVKTELSRSFFSAWDACLVLAAILALVGALRIYHNLQMGRDRFTSEVTAWFLSAIFMLLTGAFLKALYGL
ncbi:MAG: DUF4134 domain-containing protein [Pedobacter sp.]|nr:MAG: DUF4134 domain-containing protein [Pedobacter sp.]